MPAQTEYSAPAWGGSPYSDLTCPSGALVLAKRIDMSAIVSAGLMDEFDAIAPAVDANVTQPAKGKPALPAGKSSRPAKKMTKAQEKAAKEAATKAMLGNKDEMKAMGRIMALMLPEIVIKPSIQSSLVQDDSGDWVTRDPADREDGVVYTDAIPMMDQMHILAWAMEGMDSEEMARFREQSKSPVDAVEDGEGSESEAE